MTSAQLDESARAGDAPPAVIADPAPVVTQGPVAPPVDVPTEAPRASAKLPSASVVAVSILAAISALALWAVLFALVFSPLQYRGSQRQLYAEYREQLAAQTIPVGGVIEPGAPVALLQVPSIDLHDVVVVEGTSSSELEAAPGHRRDTALPGQPGLSVLMGRSELFGAPFGQVPDLHAGDAITVTTGSTTAGSATFQYKVDRIRRDGDPLPAAPVAGGSRLTLVTSEPAGDDRFARRTVFVDATLQGTAQEGDPGRPRSIGTAETSMAGDLGSMIVLVLWLEALAVAVVALAWANARWGRKQTLLVGIPVVFCILWGVSEAAVLLLPNLV